MKASLLARLARVKSTGRSLLQTALAAALSWWLAKHVLGHPRPFFAPVAAIIALGVTVGQRTRRAVEIVLGVAVGIAVADLLVRVVGSGPVAIAVTVLLAMTMAVFMGGGPLLVTQAATSAVLLATLQTAGTASFDRFFDALAGGGVALAINSLLLTTDPRELVRSASAPLVAELAAVLDDVSHALARRDDAAAEQALARARGLDALSARLGEAVETGMETARMAPPRRGMRGDVALYAQAAPQLDLAARNVRVLARGSVRALHLGATIPSDVPEAIDELAEAVRRLGVDVEDPEQRTAAAAPALRAAGLATAALERTGNLSVSVIVGQVRSTAVDLLRALGYEPDAARDAVIEAAREGRERVVNAPSVSPLPPAPGR